MTQQPERDDAALVTTFLRTRSETSFLCLYDRHTPSLYRFAARLAGGPGAEPEDLVQEAWVRAVERLHEFRWGSTLRTWLCGIVLNAWRERVRGEARDRNIVALAQQAPPRTATNPEMARRLGLAIDALPTGYREVLLLHDVEGYTHEEIARHFGIDTGTSKSQLHRARRALREALHAARGVHHG
ncbi:MAG: RNA polymerase sigma factor [bacterium]